MSFGMSGCPQHSSFNPVEFSCQCLPGYHFNTDTYLCDEDVQMDVVTVYKDVGDAVSNGTVKVAEDILEEKEDSPSRVAKFSGNFYCFLIACFSWIMFH